MIRFITSTRCTTLEEFNQHTALGQSIQRIGSAEQIELIVALGATEGLAAVYNPQIHAAQDDDILVFLHDDIYIDDWLICIRIREALSIYDVIGPAGNRFRSPNQRGWYGTKETINAPFTPIGEQLLSVGIPNHPPEVSSIIHAEVKLLDGLFIAANAGALKYSNIYFDPQFHYHLYDLDFCRQCEQADIRMGFWPLALTHCAKNNEGDMGQSWFDSGTTYLKKWGE